MEVRFTIPGPPVGYVTNNGRNYFNSKRKRAYLEYKKLVQQYAPEGTLPMVATKEKPLHIETRAFFFNGVHPDPENVHKGVKDALFWKPKAKGSKGGSTGLADKYTGGNYFPPLYDKNAPRVEVFVHD